MRVEVLQTSAQRERLEKDLDFGLIRRKRELQRGKLTMGLFFVSSFFFPPPRLLL